MREISFSHILFCYLLLYRFCIPLRLYFGFSDLLWDNYALYFSFPFVLVLSYILFIYHFCDTNE